MSRALARRIPDYRHPPSRRLYQCPQLWRKWRVWSQSAIAATAFAWAGWPSTGTWRRWGPCAAFGSSNMRRWKEESRRYSAPLNESLLWVVCRLTEEYSALLLCRRPACSRVRQLDFRKSLYVKLVVSQISLQLIRSRCLPKIEIQATLDTPYVCIILWLIASKWMCSWIVGSFFVCLLFIYLFIF